jgi:hypothetical protein
MLGNSDYRKGRLNELSPQEILRQELSQLEEQAKSLDLQKHQLISRMGEAQRADHRGELLIIDAKMEEIKSQSRTKWEQLGEFLKRNNNH